MTDPIGVVGTSPVALALASRLGGGSNGYRIIMHGLSAEQRSLMPKRARIEVAPNLYDLASECDAVFLACTCHADVRAALTGTADRPGLIGALQPGTILVDWSPGSPDECAKLAGQLSGGAIGYLEAACIGGPLAIQEGCARIFTGGFGEHILQVYPALERLGRSLRVGSQGQGRVMVALIEAQASVLAAFEREAAAIAAAYRLDGDVAKGVLAERLHPDGATCDAAAGLARQRGVDAPVLTAATAYARSELAAPSP